MVFTSLYISFSEKYILYKIQNIYTPNTLRAFSYIFCFNPFYSLIFLYPIHLISNY